MDEHGRKGREGRVNEGAGIERARVGRRGFLLAGLGVMLTGCATSGTSSSRPPVAEIPWPDGIPDPRKTRSTSGARASRRTYEPTRPATTPPSPLDALDAHVIERTAWAKGAPDPRNMNRMGFVRNITIHHDGMDAFYATDWSASVGRLELIRRAHRGRGWADIGYHFVVDRSGRVWQARPLSWQGAHVKDHNEHNIGVMAMGNFDRQQPTEAQVAAMTRHVKCLMDRYAIPAEEVRTHREWAPTACPGRWMQTAVAFVRNREFALA